MSEHIIGCMSEEIIVIDCYNVMFSTYCYSPYRSSKSMEKCRDDFLKNISEYSQNTGQEFVLVFDGYGQDFEKDLVSILYSKDITADEKIMELSKEYPEDTIYVSSDRRGVFGTMRSNKKRFLSPLKFLGILNANEK